jgi:hypothetical protein
MFNAENIGNWASEESRGQSPMSAGIGLAEETSCEPESPQSNPVANRHTSASKALWGLLL